MNGVFQGLLSVSFGVTLLVFGITGRLFDGVIAGASAFALLGLPAVALSAVLRERTETLQKRILAATPICPACHGQLPDWMVTKCLHCGSDVELVPPPPIPPAPLHWSQKELPPKMVFLILAGTVAVPTILAGLLTIVGFLGTLACVVGAGVVIVFLRKRKRTPQPPPIVVPLADQTPRSAAAKEAEWLEKLR